MKFKIRENHDQCSKDKTSFCDGDFCGKWDCPDGTKDQDSCQLIFNGDAAAANINNKYRMV